MRSANHFSPTDCCCRLASAARQGTNVMRCEKKKKVETQMRCVVNVGEVRFRWYRAGIWDKNLPLSLSPYFKSSPLTPLCLDFPHSDLNFYCFVWTLARVRMEFPLVKSRGGFLLFVVELFCNDPVACTFWLVGKKRGIIVGVWVTNDNAHPFCSTSA